MTPRRVLVTGAGGFLASALLPLLRRRFPVVVAATRVTAELSDPTAARRLAARSRPDLVFHLAGGHPSPDAAALWRDHVSATLALAEALRRASPGARLVLAGSSAEYGLPKRVPVTEDSEPDPVTLYGRIKHAQALAALSYSADVLDVRVARIFNVCGPGTPATLAPGAFAGQIAALERSGGGVLKVGDLRPRRDFVDVRDVAEALFRLGLTPGLAGCYNVCSGRATAMSEVLALLLRGAHAGVRLEVDPARVRAGEVRSIRGSHARLTRATGWRPRIPLARSLEDTLAWHRS